TRPRAGPTHTLFPYTTLFRSRVDRSAWRACGRHHRPSLRACVARDGARGFRERSGAPRLQLRHAGESAMKKILWGLGALLLLAADRKSTRLNSSHVKISYAVF